MEFSNQVEITIFKQKISLFELKCYFNLYIKDVECNKNKQEILVLLEEKEDSKMFNSTLLFTSEEELSNFRNTDNHIDLLFNSEELFEKKSSICDI